MCLLAVAISGGAVGQDPLGKGGDEGRRYEDGPLTAADFRGRPRNEVTNSDLLSAFTATEIRYGAQIRTRGQGTQWRATIASFDAHAVMLRDKSWNQFPEDERLLDHEQGHFDLAQGYALQIQVRFRESQRNRSLPVGLGNSAVAAQRDLDVKLRNYLKPMLEEHAQAHADYDRFTKNGLAPVQQAEQRQLQLARIADGRQKLDRDRSSR